MNLVEIYLSETCLIWWFKITFTLQKRKNQCKNKRFTDQVNLPDIQYNGTDLVEILDASQLWELCYNMWIRVVLLRFGRVNQ